MVYSAIYRVHLLFCSRLCFFMRRRPPRSTRTATRFPYPTRFRSHRGKRVLAEEIAREIDRAVGVARQVGGVQGGHAKHLPRTLGIGRGDDRGVDPVETLLMKETMHRLRQAMANPGDRAEQVGAWAQVRDFTQTLQRLRLARKSVA